MKCAGWIGNDHERPCTRDAVDGKHCARHAAQAKRRAALADQIDLGITPDLLHDIRRAMRVLRRAEKLIVTHHRAEKRKHAASGEWTEMKRITKGK